MILAASTAHIVAASVISQFSLLLAGNMFPSNRSRTSMKLYTGIVSNDRNRNVFVIEYFLVSH